MLIVLRRQQRLDRHACESGIAIEDVAVGEGELGAFDDGVDEAVAERVHAGQIEA